MNLEGRVAIVTGATRGIGKQIAIGLAERGADVVVAGRTVEPRRRLPGTLTETVAAIEATGRRGVAVQADVSTEGDLLRIVDVAMSEFGGIDVLVNNAAYTAGRDWGAPLGELSRESWLHQFATNLHSVFTLVQAVVPRMAEQGGGVVVNLTSAAGDLVPPGRVDPEARLMSNAPLAYGASKAALNRFANAVAPQLRARNVAIVNVEPGFVHTELVDVMVKGGFDASSAVPMSEPANAVFQVISDEDPMRWSGQVVHARDFVEEN